MSDSATIIVTILALIVIAVFFGFNVAAVFCCEITWIKVLSFISCLISAGYVGLLIGLLRGTL